MLSGSRHHQATDSRASREEDVIELLRQKGLADRDISLENGNEMRVIDGSDQFGNHCRGMRRLLGRLENGAVSGGDRPHQGPQRELKRVIPGADDQGHPQRFRLDPGRSWKLIDRGAHTSGLHPAPELLQGMIDLADDSDLEIGFKGRTAQISLRRRHDGILIVNDGLLQALQLGDAKVHRPGGTCPEKGPLLLDKRWNGRS